MSAFAKFSYGLDLADAMVGSDLLHSACAAICSRNNNEDSPFSISIQVSQLVPRGKIIAFVPSPNCTVQVLQDVGKDLVPSTSDMGTFFAFIATKLNPCSSINKAAVQVFASLYDQLSALQDQIEISEPLIITGNSLGGSIASLFTFWLLYTIYSSFKYKRWPICITFGSPLLGDYHFQQAISERPLWLSCFLHVVLNQDPIPKLFISLLYDPLAAEPTSSATPPSYKPFGSFLFCSKSGCVCFDKPQYVLEQMVAMSSESVGNKDLDGLHINYYGLVLDCLRKNTLCREISELGELVVNPLEVGLTLELESIGLIRMKQQQQHQPNNEKETLIKKVPKCIIDPMKKQNEAKIIMAILESYKRVTSYQRGYYDGMRKAGSKDEKITRANIVKHQAILTHFWKNMVEAAESMPQKRKKSLIIRWLFAGTNYRRMVEPLEIANHYRQGKRDYIYQARPEHYILLEKWFDDDVRQPTTVVQISYTNGRNKPVPLTRDSCFWAIVEEAIISCRVLCDGDKSSTDQDKELSRINLINFEDYVMGLVRTYSVSPEIFLPNTTFMDWWKEYERIVGVSYNSCLTDFMRNRYQGYA